MIGAAMTRPSDLGLPSRFLTFRSTPNFDQLGVAAEIATSTTRFNLLCAPPGTGKSLIAMTVAALTGWRVLVVVGTKGLQTQWLRDFESIGMRDVRGHANYPCGVKGSARNSGDIADDPETKCTVRPIDCGFKADVELAGTAPSVITNYAMHLSIGRHVKREILGRFDLLVLDEAHSGPDWLTNYAAVEVWDSELRLAQLVGVPGGRMETVSSWIEWGKEVIAALDELLNWPSRPEGARLRQLHQKGIDLAEKSTLNWLVVRGERSTTITPVWGRDFAEQYMFRGIPHVLGMSATMTRETGDYLGVPRGESTFKELPSPFPLARRPVVYVPTTRVDYRMGDTGMQRLVDRVDKVLDTRESRGVIHTRSYDYANRLKAGSRHVARLITHGKGEIMEAMREFKSRPDAVLVSPIVEEGFDFKGELARWQVILKVSVVDSRDPLTKARLAADPRYRYVLVSQSIMQMAGRVVRDIDDWGETLIFDDHWMYLRKDAPWPKWFKDSCRIESVVPKPLMFKPMLRGR